MVYRAMAKSWIGWNFEMLNARPHSSSSATGLGNTCEYTFKLKKNFTFRKLLIWWLFLWSLYTYSSCSTSSWSIYTTLSSKIDFYNRLVDDRYCLHVSRHGVFDRLKIVGVSLFFCDNIEIRQNSGNCIFPSFQHWLGL